MESLACSCCTIRQVRKHKMPINPKYHPKIYHRDSSYDYSLEKSKNPSTSICYPENLQKSVRAISYAITLTHTYLTVGLHQTQTICDMPRIKTVWHSTVSLGKLSIFVGLKKQNNPNKTTTREERKQP